jgi:hypothetical protein
LKALVEVRLEEQVVVGHHQMLPTGQAAEVVPHLTQPAVAGGVDHQMDLDLGMEEAFLRLTPKEDLYLRDVQCEDALDH